MFWVQDYIWELEYECPNRAECRDRTPDTHLPTRPNETYFRYTTPNIIEVLKVNDELKTLQSYRCVYFCSLTVCLPVLTFCFIQRLARHGRGRRAFIHGGG